MADTHSPDEHHGNLFRVYMIVAVALAVCTGSSFFFNRLAEREAITHFISFVLILGVAILKAVLVGLIFMHLKWDWGLVYFIIVPIFILGAMMAMVFMPDGVLGPLHDANDEIRITEERTWMQPPRGLR